MQLRSIKNNHNGTLNFEFEANQQFSLSLTTLRKCCPCAECREERGEINHNKPLKAVGKKKSLKIVEGNIETQTKLVSIWNIGNYAIGIRWEDQHDSGIFTYQYLFELGNRHSENIPIT